MDTCDWDQDDPTIKNPVQCLATFSRAGICCPGNHCLSNRRSGLQTIAILRSKVGEWFRSAHIEVIFSGAANAVCKNTRTMSGAGAAKSQLNAFYQRCKAPIPNYECKSSGQGFKCTIICPSVHTSEGSIELQIFSGKGPTKKGSQAAAAAEAVKFLQDQPLFAAKKPFSESLWETVKSNLSDQVL